MRLAGKNLLMIVTDGVEEEEFRVLKAGFESEKASVLVASPQPYPSIETVGKGRKGQEVEVDLPFEAIGELHFDGLILPGGVVCCELLRRSQEVKGLIQDFSLRRLPIFASGEAVQLLEESQRGETTLVREGTALNIFLDQAVRILLEAGSTAQLYRSTI